MHVQNRQCQVNFQQFRYSHYVVQICGNAKLDLDCLYEVVEVRMVAYLSHFLQQIYVVVRVKRVENLVRQRELYDVPAQIFKV